MNAINLDAYYETIKKKTGMSPEDFMKLAGKKDFIIEGNLKPSVKAGDVINWMKKDFGLGRGHGLAMYHYLKNGNG